MWDFVKRHWWKFAGGAGAVVGVGATAYYVRSLYIKGRALQRLLAGEHVLDGDCEESCTFVQQWQQKLLAQLTELEHEEGSSGTSEEGSQQQLSAESSEWRMLLHFERNQRVADLTVMKCLARGGVQSSLFGRYAIDEYTGSLRDQASALSTEQKAFYFEGLKDMCISRLAAALFLSQALLWLHRVEINIIGRRMFEEFQDEGGAPVSPLTRSHERRAPLLAKHEENYAFLTSTRWLQHQDGVRLVASQVDAAVSRVLSGVKASHLVSFSELMALLARVNEEVDRLLLADGRAVGSLLPSFISAVPQPVQKVCGVEADSDSYFAPYVSHEPESLTPPAESSVQGDHEAVSIPLPGVCPLPSPVPTEPSCLTSQNSDTAPLTPDAQPVSLPVSSAFRMDCDHLPSAGSREAVEAQLAEARDFLESPQFPALFAAARDAVMAQVVAVELREKLAPRGDPDAQFPLARAFGKLCALAESLLAAGSGGGLSDVAALFGRQTAVREVCEAVYFPADLRLRVAAARDGVVNGKAVEAVMAELDCTGML